MLLTLLVGLRPALGVLMWVLIGVAAPMVASSDGGSASRPAEASLFAPAAASRGSRETVSRHACKKEGKPTRSAQSPCSPCLSASERARRANASICTASTMFLVTHGAKASSNPGSVVSSKACRTANRRAFMYPSCWLWESFPTATRCKTLTERSRATSAPPSRWQSQTAWAKVAKYTSVPPGCNLDFARISFINVQASSCKSSRGDKACDITMATRGLPVMSG
mmetsp:Transcript_70984/g.170031  ORF Transcript_70984/g.170031 Transcript_70984/m.170031 type:complete len:224 (+) Transcript_70984:138-809(+)